MDGGKWFTDRSRRLNSRRWSTTAIFSAPPLSSACTSDADQSIASDESFDLELPEPVASTAEASRPRARARPLGSQSRGSALLSRLGVDAPCTAASPREAPSSEAHTATPVPPSTSMPVGLGCAGRGTPPGMR